jgi:hypothetical protein
MYKMALVPIWTAYFINPSHQSKSKTKSCYDWRSVSQYVSVSNQLWNLWPNIIFRLKVAVLSLWDALSDEKSGLSPVSHCQQYLVYCQNVIYFTCHMFYVYAINTWPLSAQAQYSRSCHNLCYNSSLDTWTVLRLTAAKFKPVMFYPTSLRICTSPYPCKAINRQKR